MGGLSDYFAQPQLSSGRAEIAMRGLSDFFAQPQLSKGSALRG